MEDWLKTQKIRWWWGGGDDKEVESKEEVKIKE